jgi:hypothetical protein
MPNTCTITIVGDTTCIDCTGQPAIPAIPPHIVETPVIGWNAGAESIARHGGDCHVVWDVPVSAGIVVGLRAPPRDEQTDPSNLTYAWYTTSLAGELFAQPMERGVLIGEDAISITSASQMEIRRVGGVVTYRIGTTEHYRSALPSFGPLLVGSCLFASGDTIE